MDGLNLCHWLEQTTVGASLRESLWLFPVVETVHLLGMAMVVGSIAILDFRLLGWVMRERRATEVGEQLLPWIWAGLAVQAFTGALLFSSEAVKLYGNLAFRIKIILLLLAGLNALIFRWTTRGKLEQPGIGPKVAACVSLLVWLGVVTAGRFIGFV